MTNGQKIEEITGRKPFIDDFGSPYMIFSKKWWDAEYKESEDDIKPKLITSLGDITAEELLERADLMLRPQVLFINPTNKDWITKEILEKFKVCFTEGVEPNKAIIMNREDLQMYPNSKLEEEI